MRTNQQTTQTALSGYKLLNDPLLNKGTCRVTKAVPGRFKSVGFPRGSEVREILLRIDSPYERMCDAEVLFS